MSPPGKIRPRPRLILASRSPRRKALLRQVGLVFEAEGAEIPESPLPGETPQAFTRRMALEKARLVGARHPRAWVLGADTVVSIEGDILGIPASQEQARAMLGRLSGYSHSVFTSFCLYRGEEERELVRTVESMVVFKSLSPQEIEGYLASGEPFDKAGAYAVQGLGAFMVREIHGSYTNVVGLPLCELIEAMKELGIIARFP